VVDSLLQALGEASQGWLGSVITAVIGFLGGVVGSVVAPWSHWGVEKRRRRQNRRRELLKAVREATEQEKSDNLPGFVNTSTYSAIRPYLSPEAIESLETIDIIGNVGHPRRPMSHKRIVLDEVTRLEQEWKLI